MPSGGDSENSEARGAAGVDGDSHAIMVPMLGGRWGKVSDYSAEIQS